MPYAERNEESGQFTPVFVDRSFLEAVDSQVGATSSDLADAVGCTYRTAHKRLSNLTDDGTGASRNVGNSLLWMLADEQ